MKGCCTCYSFEPRAKVTCKTTAWTTWMLESELRSFKMTKHLIWNPNIPRGENSLEFETTESCPKWTLTSNEWPCNGCPWANVTLDKRLHHGVSRCTKRTLDRRQNSFGGHKERDFCCFCVFMNAWRKHGKSTHTRADTQGSWEAPPLSPCDTFPCVQAHVWQRTAFGLILSLSSDKGPCERFLNSNGICCSRLRGLGPCKPSVKVTKLRWREGSWEGGAFIFSLNFVFRHSAVPKSLNALIFEL